MGLCIVPGDGVGPCYDPHSTVGDVLLTPTAIYSPRAARPRPRRRRARRRAHHRRRLPRQRRARRAGRARRRDRPRELGAEPGVLLAARLGVERPELLNTFNCGLGMVVVIDTAHVREEPRRHRKAGTPRSWSAKSYHAAVAYGKTIPLTAIPYDQIAVVYPVASIGACCVGPGSNDKSSNHGNRRIHNRNVCQPSYISTRAKSFNCSGRSCGSVSVTETPSVAEQG